MQGRVAYAEEQEHPLRPLILLTLILLAPRAGAAEFGRLFFTPEQRTQLDDEYMHNVSTESDSGVVMVNGIVQRSGGGRTVWINGVPQTAGKSDERNPASVPVAVPGRHNPVKMKVGQRLLLETPAAPQEATGK
jgi:hypothetical protein